MKTKERNKLTRIVYAHGSPELIAKYEKWQRGIAENPKFKEVERISEHISNDIVEELDAAEAQGDETRAREITDKMKQMRNERNRVIKTIHRENPELEKLKNDVITEVNNIIKKHKAHRNSPHWNAEQIEKQARQHISDRADDLKKFSNIETELYNFQQCIEQYNEMQDVNPYNKTAKAIESVPFWTEKREAYEKKLNKWLNNKEKPDPIIKRMPPELFQRIREEFAHENWHTHPDEEKRRAEIIPFMLETVQKWTEERTRRKKQPSTDKQARSKADEPEQIL